MIIHVIIIRTALLIEGNENKKKEVEEGVRGAKEEKKPIFSIYPFVIRLSVHAVQSSPAILPSLPLLLEKPD